GGPSLGDPDRIRPCGGPFIHTRVGGQPYVAYAGGRHRSLCIGYAGRWTGVGALGFPSFDQLPLGGGVWDRRRSGGSGGEGRGAAGVYRAYDSRPLVGGPPAQSTGTEGDPGLSASAGGGFRQSPHRTADR